MSSIPTTGLCVITAPRCGPCKKLKGFLSENNISFVEISAGDLPRELKPMVRGGVPVILKDGAPLMTKDKRIVTSGTIPYEELLELVA